MEIREAQRKLHCRGCDVEVQKGQKVFHTYSRRNRGQEIFFCMNCVEEIHDMFEHEYLEEDSIHDPNQLQLNLE